MVGRPVGAVAPRRVPNRSCVACRTVRTKGELIRVVRGLDGALTADETGRATGRGAYVCRAAECVDKAIGKGALSRALKTPLPADLREALMAQGADSPTTSIEGGPRGQE